MTAVASQCMAIERRVFIREHEIFTRVAAWREPDLLSLSESVTGSATHRSMRKAPDQLRKGETEAPALLSKVPVLVL